MVTTERLVPAHTAFLRGLEIDVDPDLQIQCRDRFGVEESDEIHQENIPCGYRLRLPERAKRPVEAPKGAVTFITERPEHLVDEPTTFDPGPVARPMMRSRRIQEVAPRSLTIVDSPSAMVRTKVLFPEPAYPDTPTTIGRPRLRCVRAMRAFVCSTLDNVSARAITRPAAE